MQLLLDSGADIQSRDWYHRTSIHEAAASRSIEAVSFLLDHGAELEDCDRQGSTAFHRTCKLKYARAMMRFLLSRGASTEYQNQKGRTALHEAVDLGNIIGIDTLLELENEVDLEAQDEDGKTALHLACEHKYSATHIDAIKILLRHSADLDAKDDNGNTPLHDAAAEGVEEAVKLLLDYGAEVNVPNDDGDFPLHSSTRWIQADVLQLLLDRGADPHAISDKSGTIVCALSEQYEEDRFMLIRNLLERVVDVNACRRNGGTALIAAAACGTFAERLVKLLLKKGASHLAKGGEYGNVFQAACYGGGISFHRRKLIARLIYEKGGVDVNAVGGKYGNALQAAVVSAQTSLLKFLVNKGADVNAKGGKFTSALHAVAAAEWGEPDEAVEYLIENGADVNAEDFALRTSLHVAAACGKEATVRKLLDLGSNPFKVDPDNLESHGLSESAWDEPDTTSTSEMIRSAQRQWKVSGKIK